MVFTEFQLVTKIIVLKFIFFLVNQKIKATFV